MFRTVKSNWEQTALVCTKCSKKLHGGFGDKGKTPLIKVLRNVLGKGRKASFGVVPVKCLGVCPKNAVTVIDSQRPRDWLIVQAGTPIEEVVAALSKHSIGSGADERNHIGDALRSV